MSDNPDVLAIHAENQPREYTPWNDPLMHRVLVRDEFSLGLPVRFGGYKTDVQGAKVDLHALGENNKNRRQESAASSGSYESIYFTTATGTIYHARDLEDGTWEIEKTSNVMRTLIEEPCAIEVGSNFISPNVTTQVS